MKTIYKKSAEIDRKWYIIDATGQSLGRVASQAALIIRGKLKPFFVPYHAVGDFVIVINAAKARLTGTKVQKKLYYRHSGYPGGLKVENYETLLARKPTAPMERAVRGMLPRGALGNKLYRSLKVYADSRHPHEAQKPEVFEMQEKRG